MRIGTRGSADGAASARRKLGTTDLQKTWNVALGTAASDPSPHGGQAKTTRRYTINPKRDGYTLADPALGWKTYNLVQGGTLPFGGNLTLGEPNGSKITSYDQLAVRNAVIDAQRRALEAADRITGQWDDTMIKAGTAAYGFGPGGPSWQEKVDLAQKFRAIAQRLRGNIRINLCYRHEIGGADGFVPQAGPNTESR
jgi:hypothetical protein